MNPKPLTEKKLWAIFLKGENRETFLHAPWHDATREPSWPGEPVWPLLFQTRRQANDWKRNAETEYARLGWKFRVARVVMTVEGVGK